MGSEGYAFSVHIRSKYVEFAFAVVEAFYLRTSVGAEVHKDSNGELGGTQIAESLIMLFLCQLRECLHSTMIFPTADSTTRSIFRYASIGLPINIG